MKKKLVFTGDHTVIYVNCNYDEYSRLPNVFFIGPSRTSTTFLYDQFKENNNIFVPPIKELHFLSLFDFRCRGPYERGIHHSGVNFEHLAKNPNITIHTRIISSFSDYIELFYASREEKYRIDISPSYCFYSDRVSKNIEKNFKNALIYFTPRDPILRMLSNYSCVFPRHPKTLFTVISEENILLEKSWEFFWSIKKQSIYSNTIKNFHEKGLNIKIIPYEKMFTENPLPDLCFFDFRNKKHVNMSSQSYCVELLDMNDIVICKKDSVYDILEKLNIKSRVSDPFPISQFYEEASTSLIEKLAALFKDDLINILKYIPNIDNIWKTYKYI